MINIKGIGGKHSVVYFRFDATYDTHKDLVSFFYKLKFDKDELLVIDTPFPRLIDDYLHIKNKEFKIHFFISDEVTMVIDSNYEKKELIELMKDHFEFFKNKD